MHDYREKLLPGPGVFLATALVIPASILIFAPISPVWGWIVAAILFVGSVLMLIGSSQSITVADGTLRAGRARIPVSQIGRVSVYDGQAATDQRGVSLDVRAFLVIRGWIKPVVKVEIDDPSDPTPYWLVSTRHPTEMAAAIERSRRPTVAD